MKFGLGYWGRLSSPVRRRKGWPSLTIVAMVATGLSSVVIAAGVATAPPALGRHPAGTAVRLDDHVLGQF